LTDGQLFKIRSQDIKVGQIVKITQGQRVPADIILLYTTERSGSSFIKTDQLDGETDWKLRKAVTFTQRVDHYSQLSKLDSSIIAMAPNGEIYDFKGVYCSGDGLDEEGLSLANTIWANTVLASSGFILGIVLHTG